MPTKKQKQIKLISEQLKANYLEQKRLQNELAKLIELDNTVCLTNLSGTRPQNCNVQCDIYKKGPVPKQLAKILRIDEDMSKCEATKLLFEYMDDRDMIDKKTKQITPSRKIRRLFDIDKNETVTFFNLQTFIDKLFD